MKIQLVKDECHKNMFIGRVISLCFAKTIVLQFLHIFVGYETNTITYFVYILLLLYLFAGAIFYRLISLKSICIWVSVLLFWAIGYITSLPAAKIYFDNVEIYLIFLYYLPIAVFAIRNISDTNEVMKQIAKLSGFITIISIYMIFVRSYATLQQDNYMQFSYANIPFTMAAYYYAYKFDKKFYYIVYAVGLLIIFLFGARLPLLISIAFPVLLFLFTQNSKVTKSKKIMIGIAAAFVLVIISLLWNYIFELLNVLGSAMGSHVLAKLNANVFFQSASRNSIYDHAIELIKGSGGKAHGLFADRVYLNVVYVHNIFLELIIDFGFVAGMILSIIIVYLILNGLKNSDNRDFLIFMLLAIFLRYIVSGSYLIEGLAYIYFATIFKFGFKSRVLLHNKFKSA